MMTDGLLPVLALAMMTAVAPAKPAIGTSTAAKTPATLHVTHTYLRAAPGKRAALIDYVQRNWFAMDRIGIDQGLFTSYTLLERSSEDVADTTAPDWDIIVAVGYPSAQGHDAPGVADAFRKIRAAHREVKIDGQGLAQLGAIVRHDTLRLVQKSG